MVSKRRFSLKKLCCSAALFLLSVSLGAAEIFVDVDKGDNHNAGGKDTPLKDFGNALAQARPGDTIRMVATPNPVRANFQIRGKGGSPEKPIVIDGGFNTYVGTVPVDGKKWAMISPGLYKQTMKMPENIQLRYFMCFNGKMIRMGRHTKWASAPFKRVEELKDFEWTIVNKEDFYFKIPSGKSLKEVGAEEIALTSGVEMSGEASHYVIRNMIVTHFWNDGYNIHDNCRDVLFENVAALYNGDDGVSAHETCQITIRNFISVGNGNGMCHVADARCAHENVYVAQTDGRDVFMLNAENVLSNVVVEGMAPGGIEFTCDKSGTDAANRLTRCSFLAASPGARMVFSRGGISAAEVDCFNYNASPSFPAGMVDDSAPDVCGKRRDALKRQLFGVFGDRLRLE